MATREIVETLGAEINELSSTLAQLSENPNRTVSAVSAHLLFLLSLAVRKIAFGPNEWAKVDDDAVVVSTEAMQEANSAAAGVRNGDDAIALAETVMSAISAIEALE